MRRISPRSQITAKSGAAAGDSRACRQAALGLHLSLPAVEL